MTIVSNNCNTTISSCSMQRRQCCCHHHCIRRRRRKISTTFITTLSSLLLLLLSLLQTNTLSNTLVTVVNAKEIVATNEWQLLSENDTIPAGLHVRMDLSTGEKWVKIASDDDDDEENDIKATLHNNEVDGSKVETAVMDASGALSIIDNLNINDDGSTTNNNNKGQQHTTATTKNKDYNMMHRVMSKLPPEELQKFGGLPSLPEPPPTTSKLTSEQRMEFEKQMDEIWNKRQEELRKIMTAQEEGETDIMNVPVRVLKERIKTIQYYLDNVHVCLVDILDEKQQRKEMDENGEESMERYDDLNNIINALEDLEYQLSDVDMARDFHTLGGWPYLVSLLHDNVHNKRISSTTTAAATVEKMMILVDEIQALAAMAIGTAVSNLDEFHVWALEDVSTTLNNLLKKRCYKMDTIVCEEEDDAKDVIHNAKSGVVSALSLLISSFEDELKSRTVQMGHGSSTMAIPTTNTSTSAEKYKSNATYKLRAIYALGSLLRGNPTAQQVFIQQYNGSDVLVRNVLGTLSSVRGPSVGDKTCIKLDYKFASKVLALGQDVVMDVMLHEDDYHPTTNNEGTEEEEEVTTLQIVEAFTTEEWCDLSLRMLLPPTDIIGEISSRGMKERALHAIRALAPGCSTLQYNDGKEDDDKSWGIEEVKRVRSEWNREGSDDGLDTVYRRELLTLVDDVLEVLNQKRMQNDMTELEVNY